MRTGTVRLNFVDDKGIACTHAFKTIEIAFEWIKGVEHVAPNFVNLPCIERQLKHNNALIVFRQLHRA